MQAIGCEVKSSLCSIVERVERVTVRLKPNGINTRIGSKPPGRF
jgi:hypothetical protein